MVRLRIHRDTFCLWLGICAAVMSGCATSQRAIDAGTGTVTLKVWRVLAPEDVIGGEGNWGCRLTDVQIQALVQRLQSNASIFGGNTTYAWDGLISTFTNGFEQPNFASPRRSDLAKLFEWIDMAPSSTWSSSRVNVYFSGNYVIFGATTITSFWGATIDPAGHSAAAGFYRSITINDGGFTDFGTRVPLHERYSTLEHEMCHYLARFQSRTFSVPPPSRMYDAGEHTVSGANNLLRGGLNEPDGSSPPVPLVIPGTIDSSGTEQKEVFDRVKAGFWNSP